MRDKEPLDVAFLVRSGRRERMQELRNYPSEFFYGYMQFLKWGLNVALFEDKDVAMAPPLPTFARLINRMFTRLCGLPVGLALSFMMSGRSKLPNTKLVVVTTNSMGLVFAMCRALGLVKVPVIFLSMGLLSRSPSSAERHIYGHLLKQIQLATFSREEQVFLRKLLPNQEIHYLPFGVDHHYWSPGEQAETDYVLAIGNDLNRDWATLVAAWSPSLPQLKIVTGLPVPRGSANIEVIRGDWRSQVLSDAEVRTLLRGARFVIVPLKETTQPAGQSACLQAMACGKAVILSDISGLWDREQMVDGQSILLSPPGDVASLSKMAHRLVSDPHMVEALGAAGRKVIENKLNADVMANNLMLLSETLYGRD